MVIAPQAAAPAVKTPFELILAPVPVTLHATEPLHPVAVYGVLLSFVTSSVSVVIVIAWEDETNKKKKRVEII